MRRVVVVGASSGLGRCLAVGLARRGERVALLARRLDSLESAAAEAGSGSVAVGCDVTDEESCATAVAAASEHLGGIDALIYCAGVGVLAPIETIDAATWSRSFATNVVGAASVTAAALPHLRASKGMVAYLSTVSASMTPPWPGLAAYTVSKAALDRLVDAWRAEHPDIGFTRVVVGECAGGSGEGATQLAASWDPVLAGRYFSEWSARGLLTDQLMEVEDFVDMIAAVIGQGASVALPVVAVTPRRPI